MKRYGMYIKVTGTQYVEVDCPNGEDPEEYGMSLADFNKVDNWEYEIYDTNEVDPNES